MLKVRLLPNRRGRMKKKNRSDCSISGMKAVLSLSLIHILHSADGKHTEIIEQTYEIVRIDNIRSRKAILQFSGDISVSYTHLDVYKRQGFQRFQMDRQTLGYSQQLVAGYLFFLFVR